MLCPKCNSEVSDNVKFCSNCGAQLLGIDDAPPSGFSVPQPVNIPSAPIRQKKSFLSRWYVWVFLVVFALGIIGYLNGSDPDSPGAAQPNSSSHPTEVQNISEDLDLSESEFSGTSVSTAVLLVESTLAKNFDNLKVYHEDGVIYVNIWEDGITAAALVAMEGDPDYLRSWDELVDSQIRLSESVYGLVQSLGLTEISVAINVLNDTNTDNVLLTVFNGVVFYDAVND